MATEATVMTTTRARPWPILLAASMCLAAAALAACGTTTAEEPPPSATEVAEGQRVFRFETFGDEVLWTDKLRLHEVVEKNLDPIAALAVGLKVDADALPAGILQKVDLKSPATTVALLKMNAWSVCKRPWTRTTTSRGSV